MKKERGFTLMEMLIVVAIIGILVAIAIPTYSGTLEKSKEAVDVANLRAAKACMATSYMNGSLNDDGATEIVADTYYGYDVNTATLLAAGQKPAAYGKGTAAGDDPEDHTGMYVQCKVDEYGRPTVEWTK